MSNLSCKYDARKRLTIGIDVSNLTFNLANPHIAYIFQVLPSGELGHLHFGRPSTYQPLVAPQRLRGWTGPLGRLAREYPDLGRGDFRQPAFCIHHGTPITHFTYVDYNITPKDKLPGLPSIFGPAETLTIHLSDEKAEIDIYHSYSIFPDQAVIIRSQRFVNRGSAPFNVEQASSFAIDLPSEEWDMLQLSGDWSKETQIIRRKVYPGTQGVQSNTGYSSHLHNPFIALLHPDTNETDGEVFGFSLIWSGSFSANVEQSSDGLTRVLLGLNPVHLSVVVPPGESFNTPECAAVYSSNGLGGMSRSYHHLYRHHLSRSSWTLRSRPVLLNNWEATYFDFDQRRLGEIAELAGSLGVKLFVMDDGWFGDKHPRLAANAGLGDWCVNPRRFPNGLKELVDVVNSNKMDFGIWVEPEMVSMSSELYELHPEWVLSADGYDRTLQRSQLVLDLSNPAVQDYIIGFMSALLESAKITYVKWDNNRGMHEIPSPSTPYRYILGLYRVMDELTTRFSDVLWEGCASGGGRFDPGMLYYWPQSWTSDNTDGLDRLGIQFGSSLVYPASSMGGHIAAVPNHQTDRVTPLTFRAHVAMMCGSFGFELDPGELSGEEKSLLPALITLSEKISPYVILGELYRLARPDQTNWPAVQFIHDESAVVLAYQIQHRLHTNAPRLRLQGLIESQMYQIDIDGERFTMEGRSLMASGLTLGWRGDYQSRVIWVTKM
jgi:alpha-galactosidase